LKVKLKVAQIKTLEQPKVETALVERRKKRRKVEMTHKKQNQMATTPIKSQTQILSQMPKIPICNTLNLRYPKMIRQTS